MTQGSIRSALELQGLTHLATVYHDLPTSFLYEEIVRRREGRLAHLGPMVVRTGHHMGRAPNDKFVVREPSSEETVWWGPSNQPLSPERFEALRRRMLAYLQGNDLFVQDCFLCAVPAYRTPVRVITETAWHSLLARNLLLQAHPDELQAYEPSLTILHAPHFHAIPELDGTRSEAFIILHFDRRLVLIGGTAYAGEIKKSAFTLFNYVLPQKGVLSMHAAANSGSAGHVAIFFGRISGTGKTTLSTDPQRNLIGDDEIGWSERGVFNLEGGCYAKVVRISPDDEPEIYQTTRRFGTLLESVGFDATTGRPNLDDASLTENTRAAYPISHIPRAAREATGGHPTNILMLAADAFGGLPPIAKLSPEQAVYHFLSGLDRRPVRHGQAHADLGDASARARGPRWLERGELGDRERWTARRQPRCVVTPIEQFVALQSDVSDIQQGTTAEGVHLGAMAGTVDLVQRVSTGLEVRGDVLHLAPELPWEVERLDMRIRYRGHSLDLRLTRGTLTIRGRDGAAPPITLCVDGEVCEFVSGTTRVFRLHDDATDCGTHRDDVPGDTP